MSDTTDVDDFAENLDALSIQRKCVRFEDDNGEKIVWVVIKNQMFLLPDGSTDIKHIQIFTYEHHYDNIGVELILHHKPLFDSLFGNLEFCNVFF
jgi:hypothetical protein